MGWFSNLSWLGFLTVFLIVGCGVAADGLLLTMMATSGTWHPDLSVLVMAPVSLVIAGPALGIVFGWAPALATGAFAWAINRRVPRPLYFCLCIFVGAAVSALWEGVRFHFEVVGLSDYGTQGILGAIAAGTCAFLTVRRIGPGTVASEPTA